MLGSKLVCSLHTVKTNLLPSSSPESCKIDNSTTAMHRKFVEKSVFGEEVTERPYAQQKTQMLYDFHGGLLRRRLRNRKRGVMRAWWQIRDVEDCHGSRKGKCVLLQ